MQVDKNDWNDPAYFPRSTRIIVSRNDFITSSFLLTWLPFHIIEQRKFVTPCARGPMETNWFVSVISGPLTQKNMVHCNGCQKADEHFDAEHLKKELRPFCRSGLSLAQSMIFRVAKNCWLHSRRFPRERSESSLSVWLVSSKLKKRFCRRKLLTPST